MKSIAGKFFNRSQKTDRGDYEEGSVAKFSDYNSNEIPRGGFGYKAKMLMLLPLFFLATACANLNPYDFLGAAIQYRAADPKANLTEQQRLGGGITGSLIRDSGRREYDKGLQEKGGQGSNGRLRIVEIVESGGDLIYFWSNGDIDIKPKKK